MIDDLLLAPRASNRTKSQYSSTPASFFAQTLDIRAFLPRMVGWSSAARENVRHEGLLLLVHHLDVRLFVIWHLELVAIAVDLDQLPPVRNHSRLHCLPTNACSTQYKATVGDQEVVIALQEVGYFLAESISITAQLESNFSQGTPKRVLNFPDVAVSG